MHYKKDGGHSHIKGDPKGLHDHKQYEESWHGKPKEIIVDRITQKKGNKVISRTVIKEVHRVKKPRKTRRAKKRR